ncbi:MAG TPA: 50S ribosomal protein L11 methyltransferase [Casimicrobiaceae bacterium]|nr:50S ribosomal protein L11 methyltransferase [Casimicrobiaceae bacterium]
MPDRKPADYLAVSFVAGVELADPWSDALLAAGAVAVDAADAYAGTTKEAPAYGEPATAPWPVVRLTALFDPEAPWKSMLRSAAASVSEPLPPYAATPVPNTDWVRATQAQFQPLRVSERLWIVPSWCRAPDPGATIVTLDPGLAFGTGAHPSTLLCLRWLAGCLPAGASVLDYGCGSGILAIAAAKLGATAAVGVDVDPQAVATSRANAGINRVSATFRSPDELGTGAFDVVLANILAGPLEMLAPLLCARVRPGGSLVLAGILEQQAPGVLAAYGRWFNIAAWGSIEAWVALAGVRRTHADEPIGQADG